MTQLRRATAIGGSTVRNPRFSLFAFALLLGLVPNASANAGVIVCGAPEVSAIDSSFEPGCRPFNNRDTAREKAERTTDLDQEASLPTNGPDTSGRVPNGGAPLVAHVSSGQLPVSDSASVSLPHSRLIFCPTLLPSGLFRPPRLAS